MVAIEKLREVVAFPSFLLDSEYVRDDLEEEYLLLEAARELLALKENGQTVWWCEAHATQSRGMLPGERKHHQCWEAYDNGWGVNGCCMVKASLHIHREGT